MAENSNGMKIQRESGTPGTFNDIIGVKDFDIPSWNWESIDITSHSSGGYSQKDLGNVATVEDFSFEIWYDHTNTEHAAMETDFAARTQRNYKILFPSGRAIVFPAKIAKFVIKAPVKGKFSATATLAVTGAPTFTPAS
jgi:predicted secreted protein